ncbi:thioredoxin-dependent thiol peroxidase [Candidatus Chloroploca sp. M-50]|uniref:thioredoxin-dependent peroxiredoxin n=1 Tax=Candidatus Chloroploca mongolica TaxID=2528176 RepID=A0ABS4D7F7_9CHLR|nr:thioredoxin-dependent thiol peroxidase [Candidatus Chloroploca mongolica]MBP1465377.1 thioredoxin-dependent thiol peroxidase [Candidatus Chloroploca mongolica]
MSEPKVQVGEMAPDFEIVSETGEPVKLSDFRGKKVILYFYPKDDTSGCTTQACGFRDTYPTIEEKNAVVLGVSPDGVKAHQKFKTKHNLPFTLLVDDQHTVAEAYGVWVEKSMYGKKYMGIERSHFVIDEAGVVIEAARKVKPAESVTNAVAALG